MKAFIVIAFALAVTGILTWPGVTTGATVGEPIELGFRDFESGIGSRIGPAIPPGLELTYSYVLGLTPQATIFDGLVVPPSTQTQVFDAFPEDDPADFDIIVQALTNGSPDSFGYSQKLSSPIAGSAGRIGPINEIPVPPHSEIAFIRMIVPPFNLIQHPGDPAFIETSPTGFIVRIAAFGFLPLLEVSIDIKPGESPNSINPRSKGVIPVAILTTDAFDGTRVNPLSVEFGPAGATETHRRGHIEDANGDGKPDLVLHFDTQETGIQCGDTSASLTGQTFSGQEIEGSDAITTVGCK